MIKTKVHVNMAPVQTVMKRLGVTPDGDVQQFVTNMVNHRITRYMPFSSSALATKTKIPDGESHEHMAEKKVKITGPTEITVLGPYAHYQYEGKVWVDPVTKAAGFLTANGWRSRKKVAKEKTTRDLEYDKSGNPQAGPHWDRHLMAAEGKQMAADVQKYINERVKSK